MQTSSYQFTSKWLNFASSITAFAATLYMAIEWNSIPYDSKLIVLLPFIFGIYLNIPRVRYFSSIYFSLLFFNILAFLKYVVLPLTMVITKYYFVFTWIHAPKMTNAYILIIYELLAIIVFILIMTKKMKLRENSLKSSINNSSNVGYIIAILIGLLGLIMEPSFLKRIIFLSDDYALYESDLKMFSSGALPTLLFFFIQYIQLVIFFIITKTANKPKNKNKSAFLILLIFASLLNIIIVWSSNRATVLTSLLLTGYSIWLLYPQKRRFIISLFFIAGFSVLVAMTTYRYYNSLSISSVKKVELAQTFGLKGMPFLLDIYLSGPTSVTVGMETTDYYSKQPSFKPLLSDLFISAFGIQQILTNLGIDVTKSTSSYFNKYLNRDMSLIIPIICQGRFYFGFILAPILSIIAIFLMLKFETISKRQQDIAMKYVWLLIALRFSWVLGYSMPVLIRCFTYEFIPIFLIVQANNLISRIRHS